MRVDNMDINIRQSNLVTASGTTESSRRSAKSAGATISTDQAGLTSSSGLLSLALQLSEPSTTSRVEELRSAIQNGSYNINPTELSRSIVDSALRMD